MSYRDVILARGPVAYWPLDEGGPSALDATGHGYTATGSTLGDGTFSAGSAPFGGSGQSTLFQATVGGAWLNAAGTLDPWPSSRLPNHGAPFTYEYWKRNVNPGGNGGGLLVRGTSFLNRTLLNGPFFGNQIELVASTPSGIALADAADPVDWMTWQYVVGLWTGTEWRFYVNCSAVPISGATGTPAGAFTSTLARLGYDFNLGLEMAHAAVYDRALGPDEIAAACAAAHAPLLLRFTYAPGGGTARWTVPAGRTARITHSG